MKTLNFNNIVSIGTSEYTTNKDGAIFGGLYIGGQSIALQINGTNMISNNCTGDCLQFVPAGTKIKITNTNSHSVKFIPYKD